jgi:hypothetical protein
LADDAVKEEIVEQVERCKEEKLARKQLRKELRGQAVDRESRVGSRLGEQSKPRLRGQTSLAFGKGVDKEHGHPVTRPIR